MTSIPATRRQPVASRLLAALAAACVLLAACATTAGAHVLAGGAQYVEPEPVPGKAILAPDGRTAIAPAGAPPQVVRAIQAANRIVGKPYKWGGGHARIEDSGYDCSGAVSYALRAARALPSPLDSGSLMGWGRAGKGRWITVYTNPGHAYVVIAGLRLDTSGPGERGPRWRPQARSSSGFVARHPRGL